MNPQNQMKAFMYLIGGAFLLVFWYIIAEDINFILQNGSYADASEGTVLDILGFKYLLIGVGGALFAIGAISFIIHFFRKLLL